MSTLRIKFGLFSHQYSILFHTLPLYSAKNGIISGGKKQLPQINFFFIQTIVWKVQWNLQLSDRGKQFAFSSDRLFPGLPFVHF